MAQARYVCSAGNILVPKFPTVGPPPHSCNPGDAAGDLEGKKSEGDKAVAE